MLRNILTKNKMLNLFTQVENACDKVVLRNDKNLMQSFFYFIHFPTTVQQNKSKMADLGMYSGVGIVWWCYSKLLPQSLYLLHQAHNGGIFLVSFTQCSFKLFMGLN